MEKIADSPDNQLLKFPGLNGRLYFYSGDGHFYNLQNTCADLQNFEPLGQKGFDCFSKPGDPHNHPGPTRTVVEISAIHWACKLRAIKTTNTEETVNQIITNIVSAWPHKLSISASEIESKFSSSIQKFQRMAKENDKITQIFSSLNGEELFSRFREAILKPRPYWADPIIKNDSEIPVCPEAIPLVSVKPNEVGKEVNSEIPVCPEPHPLVSVKPINQRGTEKKNIFAKLDQIIESTISLRSKTALNQHYFQMFRQFESTVFQYRELLKKTLKNNPSDCEKILKTAEKHSILRPALLRRWIQYKQSEMEMKRNIDQILHVRLVSRNDVTNKMPVFRSRHESLLLLHVPALDTWTKPLSEGMKLRVDQLAVTGILDELDTMEKRREGNEEVPWHINEKLRKNVLDQIDELAKHGERNQNHRSFGRVHCWIIFMTSKIYKPCWFSLYAKGVLQKERLSQIPQPPCGLRVSSMAAGQSSDINGPFFRVEWENPNIGFPTKFLIQYRSKEHDSESWSEKLTIENLRRPYQQDIEQLGPAMEFRIAVETCFGTSDFSSIIEAEWKEPLEKPKTRKCQKRKNIAEENCPSQGPTEEVLHLTIVTPPAKKPKTILLSPTETSVTSSLINIVNVSEVGEPENPPSEIATVSTSLDSLRFPEILMKKSKKISQSNGIGLYSVPLTKSPTASDPATFERFVFDPVELPHMGEIKRKTILLLSHSDSNCKTTFLNAMVNFIFNVQFEDNFRFQLIQKTDRTDHIRIYEIHHADGLNIPFSLNIIDVPNLSDNDDLDLDQRIAKMVDSFIEDENGIQELDIIGFVADSAQSNLSPREISFLNSVFSIFDTNLQENFRFLLTSVDPVEIPPILSAISAAKFPFLVDAGQPFYHNFNHSNFFGSNGEMPQDNISNYWFNLHGNVCFKMGVKYFQEFFSAISSVESKSLSITRNFFKERKKLESLKYNIRLLGQDGIIINIELLKNEKIVANFQAQIDLILSLAFELDEAIKLELPYGMVTNCTKCLNTCYDPFLIKEEINDSLSKDLNFCPNCPGECAWEFHSNQTFIWEHTTKKQVFQSDSEKEEYDVIVEKKLTAQKVVDSLRKKLEENERAVANQRDLIARCIVKLETLGKVNPLALLQ